MKALHDFPGAAVAPEDSASNGIARLVDDPGSVPGRSDADAGDFLPLIAQLGGNFPQAKLHHLAKLLHVMLDPQRFRTAQRHGAFVGSPFVAQTVEHDGLDHRSSGVNTD